MRTRWFAASAVLLLALGAVAGAPAQAGEDPAEGHKLFEYDKQLPLEVEKTGIEEHDAHTTHYFTFMSAHGHKVPAALSVPKAGKPPYPVVVIGHGKAQSKGNMAPYSKSFAEQDPPMAVLAFDFIFHGDRAEEGKDIYSPDIKQNVLYFAQSVLDMLRVLDFVETRPELDPDRIGYMGYAMGGIFGGILVGIDDRVKAAAFVLAGGDWVMLVAQSAIVAADPLRDATAQLANLREILAPVEPNNYIGDFKGPLLMINQQQDRIIPPESANAMYEAASDPKEIIWLRGQHYIAPAAAFGLVSPFFVRHLAP